MTFRGGFDRLGDPNAPPRYLRGRRNALPPPPPPDLPEAPEPIETPLMCTRCCITPVPAHVAWDQCEGRLVHVSVIAASGPHGYPRICGAPVLPKGEEWKQSFVPGIVVPCFHTGASMIAHLVRLGRPAQNGGPSWTGTALCGRTNSGRNKNWRPLYPAAASQADVCQDCKDAQALEDAR